MVTIVLPPKLEQAVADSAKQVGTTPELLALDVLQERFLPAAPASPPQSGKTMADFLAGYVGGLHSREFVPGGAQLSRDTGRGFTELLVSKRSKGRQE